ncbi:MAG: rod shape-determining protein MreD [Pseudomonadota bacterium]
MIHVRNVWVIPATFVVAFVLVILPLPEAANAFRPLWVSMVVLYWSLAIPRSFGIGSAWMIGLILDVAHGSLLGQNALGLCFIAYIANRLHQQIRVAPLGQQAVVVTVLLLAKQGFSLWIYGIIGRVPENIALYFVPSFLALILWPWAFVILRDVRRRYRIS